MTYIKHFVAIKASEKTVYKAITEQQGLAGWWAKETIVKPEAGFVNEFKFALLFSTGNELLIRSLF